MAMSPEEFAAGSRQVLGSDTKPVATPTPESIKPDTAKRIADRVAKEDNDYEITMMKFQLNHITDLLNKRSLTSKQAMDLLDYALSYHEKAEHLRAQGITTMSFKTYLALRQM